DLGTAPPTGTVTFFNQTTSTTLGTVTLTAASGGIAKLAVSLPAGSYDIQATYNPGASFSAGTTVALTLHLNVTQPTSTSFLTPSNTVMTAKTFQQTTDGQTSVGPGVALLTATVKGSSTLSGSAGTNVIFTFKPTTGASLTASAVTMAVANPSQLTATVDLA